MSGQLRPGLALPTPPSLPDAHLKSSMEVVIQRQDEVHVPCGPQEGWAAGVDKEANIQQAKEGFCRCQLVGEAIQFGGWKGGRGGGGGIGWRAAVTGAKGTSPPA